MTNGRDLNDLATDQAALRATVQAAVDVELFTIPLYMTALYSIQGTYVASGDSQDLWPGLRPVGTELPSTDANQRAYNTIFSVYVQEMFHLQLVSNLLSAVGNSPKFNAPTYDGTSIPYVVNLQDVPEYSDVKVELGPLNANQIELFLAIETPDWDAIPIEKRPTVPYSNWKAGDSLPQFGTIGHLYSCIHEYMDLIYTDGQTLWDKTYVADSVQVDLFNFEATYHTAKEYPEFDVKFPPNLTSEEARPIATTLIDAIVEQGEGQSASKNTVEPTFVPSEQAIMTDRGADDAEVRAYWDENSHFYRFEQVKASLSEVQTWPTWWQARGGTNAWTWQDLVVEPASADSETFAKQRAAALNASGTSAEVNDALNQSYSSLLIAMENSWTNPNWQVEWETEKEEEAAGKFDPDDPTIPTKLFPYAAMQALYTRVAAVWAANGVPEFTYVTPEPINPTLAHACQGLAPGGDGTNSSPLAISHTCAGTNSCTHQGGCGYPDTTDDGYPSVNQNEFGGGCGAPIPVAQVFNTYQGHDSWTYNGVSFKTGDKVWDTAWEIFKKANTGVTGNGPEPTNLRLVLPPS